MTGIDYVGCPWKTLENPRIMDAIQLNQYYESGNLGCFLDKQDDEIRWLYLENYARISGIVKSKQFDEQLEDAKRRSRKKA